MWTGLIPSERCSSMGTSIPQPKTWPTSGFRFGSSLWILDCTSGRRRSGASTNGSETTPSNSLLSQQSGELGIMEPSVSDGIAWFDMDGALFDFDRHMRPSLLGLCSIDEQQLVTTTGLWDLES